jgi:hypothetical protein
MSGVDPLAIGMEVRLGRLGRENVETKGRRLLIEGRLRLRFVDPFSVIATCRGTEVTHSLAFDHGEWFCSCPARGRCSHLAALQLVCERPSQGDAAA